MFKKRSFVDNEVRKIQTPRRIECACLNRNDFDRQMSCGSAPLFLHFITFVSSAAFRVQIVLIFSFTSLTSSCRKANFCIVSCIAFSRFISFLRLSYFLFHKRSAFIISSNNGVSKFFDLQAQKFIFKQNKNKRSKQENYPLFTAEERLVIHLSI